MSAEVVLKLSKREDRNGDDYYFGFFDAPMSLDLEHYVVLVFPGKVRGDGALMKICLKDERKDERADRDGD